MKRTLLLATTAGVLAFAGSAATPSDAKAEGLQANIGGFYNWLVIGRDQDPGAFGRGEVDPRSYDFNQRGRYTVSGSYTLDTGMTVGFQSQHEIQQSFGTDRAYVFMSGDFGMLQAGNHQSAAYQLHTFVGGAGWGLDDTAHTNEIVAPGATSWNTILTVPYGPVYIGPRVNYFTPRINGFQAGVSFTPDSSRGSDGQRFVTDKAIDLVEPIQEDIISAAVNFAGTFQGFDVSASAGGEFSLSTGDFTVGAVEDEFGVFSTGIALGWQNWEASFAYAYRNMSAFSAPLPVRNRDLFDPQDPGADTALVGGDDGSRQDFGGSLTMAVGPWTVGPSFGYVRDKSSQNQSLPGATQTFGREELWIAELGANYALGPGVNIRGSAMYVDWDSDESQRDGDGIGVGVGMALTF